MLVVHTIPSAEEGRAVLATVPAEGGPPTWLTDPIVVRDPAWSPDGTRIAFAGSPGGPYGIYVLDLARGDFRLVPGTDGIDVARPTWSADGSRISFQGFIGASQDRGPWYIYVAPVPGSYDATETIPAGQGFDELVNVTATPEVSETAPAWSPDGRTIAFVAENADGSLDLFLINADGTGRTRITTGPGNEYGPAWSPDGEMIAYAVRQVDPGFPGSVCHLRVVDVVTLEDRSLLSSPGSEDCPGQYGIAWGVRPPAGSVVDGTATPTPGATATPTPEATATPGATAPPTVGEDIGLGFLVCDVTSVPGTFAGDRQGVAYVASRVPPGGPCPRIERAEQVLAVDVGGDGAADVSLDLPGCDPFCTAYAAPDVDGDGTSEVLVANVQFSIVGLRLYDVVVGGEAGADGLAVVPMVLHGEGDPAVGLEPGAPPQLWRGGDAFEVAGLACAPHPEGRVLVYAEAREEPHDSPDAVWKAHEVTLRLEGSSLGIVGTRDVETSSLDEIRGWDPAAPVCGARPRW